MSRWSFVDCDCGRQHFIGDAGVGERVDDDVPGLWQVADEPMIDAWAHDDSARAGRRVQLSAGTSLRSDQRVADVWWRHETWDRFSVLGGPLAGQCVNVMVAMPGSPVSPGLAPVETSEGPA